MNKTIAGLGVLALVALGATGATFPANALEIQPVAEIVAQSDAIIASPDAVLLQSEPAVTTTPAEVPAGPVVAAVEPLVTPEPVTVVAEAPVVSVPVVVPAEGSTAYTVPSDSAQLQRGDAWAGAGTYYNVDPVDWDTVLAAQCATTADLNVARWCAFTGIEFPAQLMSSMYGPENVAVDPYSGNPIRACANGESRAEDSTCVAVDYWSTTAK